MYPAIPVCGCHPRCRTMYLQQRFLYSTLGGTHGIVVEAVIIGIKYGPHESFDLSMANSQYIKAAAEASWIMTTRGCLDSVHPYTKYQVFSVGPRITGRNYGRYQSSDYNIVTKRAGQAVNSAFACHTITRQVYQISRVEHITANCTPSW